MLRLSAMPKTPESTKLRDLILRLQFTNLVDQLHVLTLKVMLHECHVLKKALQELRSSSLAHAQSLLLL